MLYCKKWYKGLKQVFQKIVQQHCWMAKKEIDELPNTPIISYIGLGLIVWAK